MSWTWTREEDEHLGGGVEREFLDACGNGAEARDQRGASGGAVASVSEQGPGMGRV